MRNFTPDNNTIALNSYNGVSNGVRTFFSACLISLALFAGMFLAASVAHAQDAEAQEGGFYGAGSAADIADQEQGQAMNAAAASAASKSDGANTPISAPGKPDFSSGFPAIMQWIMLLFAWLLGIAIVLLDNAVFFTVVKMGDYVRDLSAIGVAWRVMRDFGNIVLIFGFLAIGINTILNASWYGWGRKALPMLLVAAVFLNFSLFISQAVIDTGNLFATQFYTQINGGTAAGQKGTDPGSSYRLSREGISNKIMGQTGLQTLYNTRNDAIFKADNSWIIGFMGILLFLIAAFVMFALAFILIARFVYLIFLMIIAPIGFAGLAVPKLEGTAKWWWGKLFSQTITAPVLLLMLYIALAVITDDMFLKGFGGGNNNAGDWVGVVQNATNTNNVIGLAGMLLSFLVAMGLLLFVVILSNKMSAFGGDWATKTAGKLSFGLTGWAGRSTVGWGAQRTGELLRKTRLASVPILGRAVIGTLDRTAKGSFDARGVKAFGGLGGLGMGKVGDAQKGGYRQWEKDRVKEREEYAKTLPGREQTTEEKELLAKLENEKKEVQRAERSAVLKTKDAERVKTEAEAEMEAIKAARRADTYWDTKPENRARAAAATAAQASAEANLAAAKANLEAAKKNTNAKEEEEKIMKAEVQDAVEDRGSRQEQYAAGIKWGPGYIFKRNRTAAENIIKNVKKSKSDRDVDTLKEILEKGSKGDKDKDKDKDKEEEKK